MSRVSNTNFLQPTGFRVIINREKLPNLEWFAQSVDHPSVGAIPPQQGYKRITDVPYPGDKLEFAEVTFNIILDEDMKAYEEAYQWMRRLVEKKYVPPLAGTDLIPSSECDVTLMTLTSANRKSRSIVYRNAFPISIGNIPLAAEQEPEPIIVPVTFNYTYFDII